MERNDTFSKVLSIFAHYGFRKASMEDLARAADVSRQTLYKRFKTKEAVLDWAVEGYARENRERVSAELKNHEASLSECLLNAFARWAGEVVPLLHDSPHGAEIMDMGTESLRRSGEDFHADFEAEIAQFLMDRGVCGTKEEAADATFLLHMSSKGLLLKSLSSEEFQAGMSRIIRAVTQGFITTSD
ncbi:MAG: TetR/AcrR family transcriptional regulator [Candidatus Thiodiazotropha endolucinida]